MDSSGNISTPGSMTTGVGSGVGGYMAYTQGTATTAPTSSVGFMAPASVTTKFMMTLPAAPTTGFMLNTGTTDPSTISFVASSGSGNVALVGSPAFTGTPTAPTATAGDNTTQLATDAFVTTAVANAVAGVNPAVAVLAASTANLTGTYVQVGGGIGDTFTITATGAFSMDGVAFNTIGQRALLKNQTSANQNGVYTVTVPGSTGISAVFTRALDYDTPSDVNNTGAIPVQSGTANSTTSWLLTSQVTSIGSSGSSLTYAQFSYAPASLVTTNGTTSFSGAFTFTGTVTATTNATFPSGTITLTQVVASGQTAMPTGALSGNTCSASATTATATGAATTDAFEVNYASDPTGVTGYGGGTSGGITIRSWATSNTINFKLCNETSSSITPGALNVNWRVVR